MAVPVMMISYWSWMEDYPAHAYGHNGNDTFVGASSGNGMYTGIDTGVLPTVVVVGGEQGVAWRLR